MSEAGDGHERVERALDDAIAKRWTVVADVPSWKSAILLLKRACLIAFKSRPCLPTGELAPLLVT
jgi:hypothetical protein